MGSERSLTGSPGAVCDSGTRWPTSYLPGPVQRVPSLCASFCCARVTPLYLPILGAFCPALSSGTILPAGTSYPGYPGGEPEAGGPEAGGPEAGGPDAGGPEAGGPASLGGVACELVCGSGDPAGAAALGSA